MTQENKVMPAKDYINQFKQQLTVKLLDFIVLPNNKTTRHQMIRTIHNLIVRFNNEGRHITVDADLMSGLNDIRLILTIMKGIQPSPDCGFKIISFCIR